MRILKATGLMALLAALALSACGSQEPAPVTYRGSGPAAPVAAAPTPGVQTQSVAPAPLATPAPTPQAVPSGGGVVDYGGYKAVVARSGDTLASMASRAGLSPSELANYNGIPSGWSPKPGDELILPPGAGQGAALNTSAATRVAAAPAPQQAPAPIRSAAPSRLDLDGIERSLDRPVSPQPPTAAALSSRAAQAPSARPAAIPQRRIAAAPARASTAAARPAPTRSARPPAAPQRAAAASSPSASRFAKPVDGAITRGFHQGGAKNDGIDFAAPAGAPVKAAAEGEVALISDSLGGLGTIVLIRHGGDLLTVYGRVDGVSVSQGERVARGQRIGKVAAAPAGRDPSLHFEVRRGAEAVDPANYL